MTTTSNKLTYDEIIIDLEMLAAIHESQGHPIKAKTIKDAITYLQTRNEHHRLFASTASAGV